MLHVIKDARTAPAHFGAMAALLASALQSRAGAEAVQTQVTLAHLPTQWDLLDYPEAVQHVAAQGALLPSGLLWSERVLGFPAIGVANLDILMAHAATHDIVLPLHPSVSESAFLQPSAEDVADQRAQQLIHSRPENSVAQRLQWMSDLLTTRAQAAGMPIRTYSVTPCNDAWSLIDDDNSVPVEGLHYCRQDRFGRWQTIREPSGDALRAVKDEDADNRRHTDAHGTEMQRSPDAAPVCVLHVALIGSERDQYGGYPATLAALGDAADAAGIYLTIDFVTPQALTQENIAARLRDVDGIVLPGGSDMARVAGQIEAARFAYQSQLPAVGLCLGMQSMATAVARIALNNDAIGLAEVGASLPGQPFRHSFVPIDDSGPLLHHRLGDRQSDVVAGSRLQTLLGDATIVRYNHRYRLNDDLIAPLKIAGVAVCAWGEQAGKQTGKQTGKRAVEYSLEAGCLLQEVGTPADGCNGAYVDAIEAPAHPFFIGMQGHPELSSTEASPHPLLVAFLRAAQAASRDRQASTRR